MATRLSDEGLGTKAVTIAHHIRTAKRSHAKIAKAQTERDQAVRAACAAGATQAQVADALGMTHTGVQYILKQATP